MNPKKFTYNIKLLAFIFLSVICSSTYSASFLCSTNSSPTENLICTDSTISQKDTEMALIYKELLGRKIRDIEKNDLIIEQRKWLKMRNACSTVACLNKIYDNRIRMFRIYKSFVHEITISPPQCIKTVISEITARLNETDPRETGSTVVYKDYVSGISYDYIPAISQRSRVNDPVTVCLVSKLENCPKGDDRGSVYHTTNLRTGESWTLPSSQHMCGGA